MPFNKFNNNKYSPFKVQLKKAYSNIEITGYSDYFFYYYFKYCKSILYKLYTISVYICL